MIDMHLDGHAKFGVSVLQVVLALQGCVLALRVSVSRISGKADS